MLGIEDTIRAEVPQAVADITEAGVTVRMVTGDNIDTAQAIAIQCGILSKDDRAEDCCMQGAEFFKLCGGAPVKTY